MSFTYRNLQRLMQQNMSHGCKLGEALNNLRKENQLCDTTISVGGRAFPAHKSVLAASCRYFLEKFTSGAEVGAGGDGSSVDGEVSIDGKPEIFETLLEFAYTGRLKMSEETKSDILEMAGYMQFTDEVYAKCIKSKSPPADYTKKLVEALNDFKTQNQLCDVVVNISGRSFRAHKVVLAANSKYFLAMFTSGFKEKGESEIKIEGNPDIFGILLDYLYTGKLKIAEKTVCAILEMACYMQFLEARSACAKFIRSKYKPEESKSKSKAAKAKADKAPEVPIPLGEVCKVWEIAHSNGLKKLADVTEKYLCKLFKELKTLDVFLEMKSADFFKQFLKQDDLATEEEENEVLEMVVSWLKHDWESRRSHAHSILTHVKLGLVPAEMLTNLLDVQILGVDECKQLYDEALKAQASGRPKAELIHKMPGLFATRSTITAPIALHVAKKEDTEHSQFFYYNTQGHQWESLPGFHNLDFMASFITVDGSLYAAGGLQKVIHYWQNFDSDDDDDDEELAIKRIDRECTDEFQVYDAAKCAWDYLPSMITARCKFTMLYVDGCIYAIGGKDEREDSVIPVERYDIAKKEWEAVAPLPKGLQLACAVVYEGKILVQGELSDPDDKYQNFLRILVYDPSQNEWKTAWERESDSIWIGSEDTAATPVMVPYQGKLYDVSYYPQDFDMEAYIDQPIPTVREWKIGEGVENIELSKESNDINNFTLNKAGAFQIKDEIFLNIRGFVCKSDIKLTPEQIEDYDEVDLRSWENLAALLEDGDCSMIVNFTFDKKRLCDQ